MEKTRTRYNKKICSKRTLCDNDKCKICFDRSLESYKDRTSNDKLKIDCWYQTKNVIQVAIT